MKLVKYQTVPGSIGTLKWLILSYCLSQEVLDLPSDSFRTSNDFSTPFFVPCMTPFTLSHLFTLFNVLQSIIIIIHPNLALYCPIFCLSCLPVLLTFNTIKGISQLTDKENEVAYTFIKASV